MTFLEKDKSMENTNLLVSIDQISYKFKKGEIALTKWQNRIFFVFVHLQSIRSLSDDRDNTTSEEDLVIINKGKHITPIYWISFPGFRGRIASHFRWWADECKLSKVTPSNLYKQFGQRQVTQYKLKNVLFRNNFDYNFQSNAYIKSDDADYTKVGKNDPSAITKWWITPYPLRKELDEIRNQTLKGTFVTLPKSSRFNVLSIISKFEKFFYQLSQTQKVYRAEGYAKENIHFSELFKWVHTWIKWFDIFFLDLGTYSEDEYNYIIASIEKSGKLSSRLSEVLGIEHFARCLDQNILIRYWMGKLKLENSNSLEGCKITTQLLLRFMASSYYDFAGTQIYGDIEEII